MMPLHGQAGAKGGHLSEQYRWFVGIDWATERHEVVFSIPARVSSTAGPSSIPGRVSLSWSAYLKEVTEGQPWELAAGVETPRGAIIESLIEQQFHV